MNISEPHFVSISRTVNIFVFVVLYLRSKIQVGVNISGQQPRVILGQALSIATQRSDSD